MSTERRLRRFGNILIFLGVCGLLVEVGPWLILRLL